MSLITKVEHIDTDKTGRVITVKNTTGVYNVDTNPGGFGGINPPKSAVSYIVFGISDYDQSNYNYVRYVRTQDPNNPQYLVTPNLDAILDGTPVELNSITLGITDPYGGLLAFNDGVLDLNMYTAMNLFGGVVGNQGDIYISVPPPNLSTINLDDIYYNYHFIMVGEDVYEIDHRIPTNNGTVLYLTEPLKVNIDSFYPVHVANTKIYNSRNSDCCIAAQAGKLSLTENCCRDCKDKTADNLFRVIMYKISAQLNFSSGDYEKSNDLLKAALRGCETLNCKC